MRVVSIDGEMVAPARAMVSVFDRGFLYGDGVFESLRVYDGRIFACAEHLSRLGRSAQALGMELPVPEARLAEEIADAVAASSLEDAYVRVMLTRGTADEPSLVPPDGIVATRVVLVEPLRLPSRLVYERGLRAVTVTWSRGPDGGAASRAKLLSYVPSLVALGEARSRGADEAIFVGADGRVRDASTSNVIVVRKDGSLVTPSDGPGVLGGITRHHVLDLACAMGASCSFQSVTQSDLRDASEVLLTSSIREIASVVSLDGHVIAAGIPGTMARALHRAYRLRVGARGPAPWE